MSRFKLSLRDLFTAITAFCAQFGLLAVFFSVTDEGRNLLVMVVHAASCFLVPVALAVVVSDVRRHRPLLSGVLAFVLTILLLALARTNLIDHLLGVYSSGGRLYPLVVWCCATTLGFVCAWITRCLIPPDSR